MELADYQGIRMERSIILQADSYKPSQFLQYPKNTVKVFSYIESRGGEYDETVVFGLQPKLRQLTKPITQKDIDRAEKFFAAHGEPFNKEGWQYILDTHQGKLPLIIRSVKEGTVVPTKNVLVTVENTDPKCFWLTSYIETFLLKVWYPITVASTSYKIKKIIKRYLELTADDTSGLPFKLHDFGYRGVSSEESAEIGGAAHLVNFMGTDTIAGILHLEDEYGAKDMTGFSIPASEHSTITSWGRENEFKAYQNMVKVFAKAPIFACVSDSYNIWKALDMWKELEPEIVANGQMLVVRPDSGDPILTSVKCVKELAARFGYTLNSKGYRVLKNVRVIYGDGISHPGVIEKILYDLKEAGYSADNMAFGMGGGLLQKCDRDTLKFAMKCSAIVVEEFGSNKIVEVYKDPIDDPGKTSKKGFLDLIKVDGKYETVQRGLEPLENSELHVVFHNGELVNETNIYEIRERAVC
jgi:nicotinamide phosphoribosyltransferase